MHFRCYEDPRAVFDRAWKLRPVIESLQERFKAGYIPPPIMAFDEAIRPRRRTRKIGRSMACPKVLKNYQTYMGGVDVHDQLRLQWYSLQLAVRYKKYYKILFVGCVDLVMVNALLCSTLLGRNIFIFSSSCISSCVSSMNVTGKSYGDLKGSKALLRSEELPKDLSNTNLKSAAETRLPTAVTAGSGRSKSSRVFLCCKVKHDYDGKARSCFDIWNECWRNETLRPSGEGSTSFETAW
ncbi:LOW QUALITY PROTEIN: hypothetical protein PHMEG_00017826, partial [Phytophthora megakarya]